MLRQLADCKERAPHLASRKPPELLVLSRASSSNNSLQLVQTALTISSLLIDAAGSTCRCESFIWATILALPVMIVRHGISPSRSSKHPRPRVSSPKCRADKRTWLSWWSVCYFTSQTQHTSSVIFHDSGAKSECLHCLALGQQNIGGAEPDGHHPRQFNVSATQGV